MTLDDVRTAFETRNDDAVDEAITALADMPMLQIESIDLVINGLRTRAAREAVITSWQFKLASALERAAMSELSVVDASACARRAARLQRDTLNDGEGATRALVLALRLSAEDDSSLRESVDVAGGVDPAQVLLEKAIKRAKGDDELQGRLRRALARLCEVILNDGERAFFEGLKAARKLPNDGLVVDDVYRLALSTHRIDEAAAFFQSLAEEGTISARTRATAFNKLGALLEHKGDRGGAFEGRSGQLGVVDGDDDEVRPGCLAADVHPDVVGLGDFEGEVVVVVAAFADKDREAVDDEGPVALALAHGVEASARASKTNTLGFIADAKR